MATPFIRTVRSLDSDRAAPALMGLLLGAGLFGAWAGWFVFARVSLYAVSEVAVLQAVREPHPVDAAVSGQVLQTNLSPGRRVQAGDVLVELDAAPQQLELGAALRSVDALAAKLSALRAQAAAQGSATAAARETGRTGVAEAQARWQEAEAAAEFARRQAQRVAELRGGGYVTEEDSQRAAADAAQRQAAARALQLTVERLGWEYRRDVADRRAGLQQAEGQRIDLEAQIDTGRVQIARLQRDISLRRVTAPIDGRLGDVVAIQVGSVVAEGQRLATVVPVGSLKLVADFAAPRAMGRLRVGQRAELRLAALPWTQYGGIRARVARLSAEPSHGSIRAELFISPDANQAPRLEHGMNGITEVEVDRVSPLLLLIRKMGWLREASADQ